LKGVVDGGVHAENRWAERADLTAAFCVLVVVPADANFRLDILSQPLIMRAGQSQTPGIRGLKGYTRLSALATPWKATVRTCTSNVFGSANKIAARTNSDDTSVRLNGAWLIKEMKAAVVPEL
jgi:hypothetical protein